MSGKSRLLSGPNAASASSATPCRPAFWLIEVANPTLPRSQPAHPATWSRRRATQRGRRGGMPPESLAKSGPAADGWAALLAPSLQERLPRLPIEVQERLPRGPARLGRARPRRELDAPEPLEPARA